MSHFVTGLVARPSTLEPLASALALHDPVALPNGFSILPLRKQDFAFLTNEPTRFFNGFNHWSESLSSHLREWSKGGTIVYFETEYHGGTGVQAAAVFDRGSMVFGPKSSTHIGPINEALQLLGVVVAPEAHDEFETVGLQKHRSTDEWLSDVS